MMRTGYWMAIVLITLTPLALDAARAAPPPPPTLENLDTDGDGRVSQEEFVAHAPKPPDPAAIFDHIDTNDDGYLDADEIAAAPPPGPPDGTPRKARQPPPSVEKLDHDGDGLISKDEFVTQAPRGARDPSVLFDQIDANDDGYLDGDELARVRPPKPQPASYL